MPPMTELPTGTVTFLFTDIEGSTRLLQALGERWTPTLEEHNRVLREAYDLGYRGYVGLECRPKTTELAAAQGVARADVW